MLLDTFKGSDKAQDRWLIFYASNHGFGHLTRVMAIIDQLMVIGDYRISLVTGDKQGEFAKFYLKKYGDRIEVRTKDIDVGIICYENSLDVDVKKSNHHIKNYLNTLDYMVEEEVAFYRDRSNVRIIVDISILGIRLGKILGVPTTLITNFTWCEQYEHFHMDRDIIDTFEREYRSCDSIIEYDVSLGMERYGKTIKTGVLSREIDYSKVEELRKKYGRILMVSCGKSASLGNIKIINFEGTIIKTSGIEVESSCPVIELPLSVSNTQDYVAASEMIITKAGWGTIGEGLVGHTPMLLIERDVREDSEMTANLVERRLALSITTDELKEVDYIKWSRRIDNYILKENLDSLTNSALEVANLLLN